MQKEMLMRMKMIMRKKGAMQNLTSCTTKFFGMIFSFEKGYRVWYHFPIFFDRSSFSLFFFYLENFDFWNRNQMGFFTWKEGKGAPSLVSKNKKGLSLTLYWFQGKNKKGGEIEETAVINAHIHKSFSQVQNQVQLMKCLRLSEVAYNMMLCQKQ